MKKLLIIATVLMVLPKVSFAVEQQTKLQSAIVNKGEFGIQLNSRMFTDEDRPLIDNTKNFDGEVSYGFSDSFEFGANFIGSDDDVNGFEYDMTGGSFTLQLSEDGNGSPVAAALRGEYDASHDDAQSDVASGALLFTHQGESFEYGLNVGVFSEVGDNANQDIRGDIRASMNYIFSDMFKPGIEYYTQTAELNDVENFDDQQNRVGPVIYGNLTDGLSYEAGYLFGISDTAPDVTYKLGLEYKMDLDDLRNPTGY